MNEEATILDVALKDSPDDMVDASPVRRRKVAGQDPAKREQILAGARRVFSRMGYDAASMNDITREAGVSKGTIYVYFDDKEDLFEALIEYECNTMFADMFEALDRAGDMNDLRGTLYRHGVGLVRKVTSPIVIRAQRIVVGICERKPDLGARFYENGPRRGHKRLMAFFDAAVAGGKLVIPDTEMAAHQFGELCLAGMSRQLLFYYRDAPPGEDEIARRVSAAVDMFLNTYDPTRRPA